MDINKFIALITEDKERHISETGLAKKTGVPRGTIHHWLKELKTEPKIDMLNKYASNIDAPNERKWLYYEYCGYPVPQELFHDKNNKQNANDSSIPDITPNELELLKNYKSLSKEKKKLIDDILKEMTLIKTTNNEIVGKEDKELIEALKEKGEKIILSDGTIVYMFPEDNTPENIKTAEKLSKAIGD